MEIRAHTAAGYEFASGIIDYRDMRSKSREIFKSFYEKYKFSGWHIVDGWVHTTHKLDSGKYIPSTKSISWIKSHAGYSHTYKMPSKGDAFLVIDDSPDVRKEDKFKLYCFKVIKRFVCPYDVHHEIFLEYLETKVARFNKELNKYQMKIGTKWLGLKTNWE